MYGWIYPHIVYGWRESGTVNMISEDWLEKHNIELFSSGCTKFHANRSIYGIIASFNTKTGQIYISPEQKDIVDKAFNLLYPNNNIDPEGSTDTEEDENEPPYLGYFRAIRGDFSFDEFNIIDPNYNSEDDDI